jgi:hypothetical protein
MLEAGVISATIKAASRSAIKACSLNHIIPATITNTATNKIKKGSVTNAGMVIFISYSIS